MRVEDNEVSTRSSLILGRANAQTAGFEALENTKTANRISINPPSPAATAGGVDEEKVRYAATIRLPPKIQNMNLP